MSRFCENSAMSQFRENSAKSEVLFDGGVEIMSYCLRYYPVVCVFDQNQTGNFAIINFDYVTGGGSIHTKELLIILRIKL